LLDCLDQTVRVAFCYCFQREGRLKDCTDAVIISLLYEKKVH